MNDCRIRVGVGAVIPDEHGRVLLVRHKKDENFERSTKRFWQGKWICPGGWLKEDEKLEDGAIREVKEETHLDIKIKKHIYTSERMFYENGELKLHVIYIDFLAEVVSGDAVPVPDSDVGELRWFSAGDIESMKDEIHEDTLHLLRSAGLIL